MVPPYSDVYLHVTYKYSDKSVHINIDAPHAITLNTIKSCINTC